MDILSLILACSINPQMNDEIRSIAAIVSQDSPLYIYDKTNESRYTFHNEKDAAILLNSLNNYNAGIVSINEAIAAEYGLSAVQTLDACTNIKVASKVLTNLSQKCKQSGSNDPHCVLYSYGAMVGMHEEYLEGAVINHSAEQKQETVDKLNSLQAERSSIFPDGSNSAVGTADEWSNNGLFINIPDSDEVPESNNKPPQ